MDAPTTYLEVEYDPDGFTPPTFNPMALSVSTLVYTGRTTRADIMSVINTTSVVREGSIKSPLSSPKKLASDSPSATLPYKKTLPRIGATVLADTPWTKMQLEKTQRERNAQLIRERDDFMTDLRNERYDEEWLQHRCVTKIQAIFRGFRKRPRTLQQYEMRSKFGRDRRNATGTSVGDDEYANEGGEFGNGRIRGGRRRPAFEGIQEELCNLAKLLRLRNISGLTLEPKSIQLKRRRKLFNSAALRIQHFFQMLVAKRKAKNRIYNLTLNMKNAMVRRIVRFFKFCFLKSFRKKAHIVKRGEAANRVQTCMRSYLAWRRVRLLKKQVLMLKRHNHASIIITRNYRPFCRRMEEAREAPRNVMADEVVSKITDLCFEENLALLVQQEAAEMYTKELQEDTSEVVFALLSDELADAIFDQEVALYIEEQIRMLEEIRRRMEEERLALEAERLRIEAEMEAARFEEEERVRKEAEKVAKQAEVRRQAEKARLEAEKEMQLLKDIERTKQVEAQILDEDATATTPQTWQERLERARSLHRLGRYSLALSFLAQLFIDANAEEAAAVGNVDLKLGAHGERLLCLAAVAVLSAECHAELGDYEEAREKFIYAEEVREKVAGRSHALVAETELGLANLYKTLGQYPEAEASFKESLAILEAADAAQQDDALVRRLFCAVYCGIADMHLKLGNCSQTESFVDRMLHFIDDRFGPEEDERKEVLSNCLAVEALLFETQGLLHDAVETNKEMLSTRQLLFGDDHPAVAVGLTQLGRVLIVMGDYQEALKCIDSGLQTRRRFLGEHCLLYAESLYAKAVLCLELGQYKEATELMQESLNVRTRVFGQSYVHELIAQSVHGLADIARERGIPTEAHPIYEMALAMRLQCFPTLPGVKLRHKSLVDCGYSMGLNLLASGKFQEAFALLEQTAKLWVDLLPHLGVEEHWESEVCNVALAHCLCYLGNLDRAKALLASSNKALLQYFGGNSLRVAGGIFVLGKINAVEGLYMDAEALMDKCLKVQTMLLGDTNARLIPTLQSISLNLLGPGNYDEAVEACNKGLEILAPSDTPRSTSSLLFLYVRGQIMRDTGVLEDAQQLYEQALLGLRAELGGEESPYFALVLGDLGECLRLQGNLERADIVLHEALRLRITHYGEVHVLVGETLRSCALVSLDRRQAKAALSLIEDRVLPIFIQHLGQESPATVYSKGLVGLCLKEIDAAESGGGGGGGDDVQSNAQNMIDDALDFFDAYKQGRFSDMHPWILRLGGFLSPSSSRVSTALPSSRLTASLSTLRPSRPNTSPGIDVSGESLPAESYSVGSDSPERFSSLVSPTRF